MCVLYPETYVIQTGMVFLDAEAWSSILETARPLSGMDLPGCGKLNILWLVSQFIYIPHFQDLLIDSRVEAVDHCPTHLLQSAGAVWGEHFKQGVKPSHIF